MGSGGSKQVQPQEVPLTPPAKKAFNNSRRTNQVPIKPTTVAMPLPNAPEGIAPANSKILKNLQNLAHKGGKRKLRKTKKRSLRKK